MQPNEVLKDQALEQRARQISSGLRCLVCQNQSIDDSDAPLAKDLRVLVRERLVAGDDDKAVIDFVVARILNLLGIPQDMLPRWGEHHLSSDE